MAPGEALALIGPNGAGKSTLLATLAGLIAPIAGALRWSGAPLHAEPEHRAAIGFLGHKNGLAPDLSVRENLDFAAGLMGRALSDDEARRALAVFGLKPLAHVPARRLSQGQARRAALARLIAPRRALWLLDEPGAGLDKKNRAALERAIAAHRAQGGMVVAASHGDVALDAPLVLDFAPEGGR